MLTLPDFNRLRVFHAVYHRRSILHAAKDLFVTRSAISQSLKALEEEMGASLFTRSHRAIVPTAAADRLFEVVHPFVDSLRRSVIHWEKGRTEPAGLLRIGAPLEFGSRTLTHAIAEFRREHPSVRFEVTLAIPPRLLDAMAEGKLDFAFIDNGDVFKKSYPIQTKPVWKEAFVLAASSKYHRREIGKSIAFTELVTKDFVDYVNHGPVLKMWFKHHFGKAPSELSIALSIESVHGVVRAIECGVGLGVVPESIIRKQIDAGSIRLIDTGKPAWINRITLATLDGKTLSLTEQRFINHCLNRFGPRSDERFRPLC